MLILDLVHGILLMHGSNFDAWFVVLLIVRSADFSHSSSRVAYPSITLYRRRKKVLRIAE